MNFKQLTSKYVLGNLPADQLPEVAYKGLKEGYDSPSLVILAGIEKNENLFVIDKYFKLALGELNISIPNTRTAALQYACAIADEIIRGEKDTFLGIFEIIWTALDKYYDFILETKTYVYDSIFFEEVYGSFDLYDDLINDGAYARHQNLIPGVKIQTFDALKKWREKMDTVISC